MSAINQLGCNGPGHGLRPAGCRANRIGLSLAALLLAGSAILPAAAQTANLGGLTVSRNDFVNFNPPGTGIEPSEITNGLLRINPLTALSYAGDLTDSGGTFSLLKFGTNDLTLFGLNTHSGQTTVQGGRLIAGSATAFSPNSLLAAQGPAAALAIADLNGFNQTARGLVGNGTGVITSTTGPAVLTIDTSVNWTFNGALQGQLGIVKRGTSTQTFTNLNPALAATNATGPITLEAGTIRIGSSNALGSGAMTVTGAGTLSVSGAVPLTFNNAIALLADLTVSPAGNQALTLGGTITGGSRLTKLGVGQLTITGANSYSGGTSLSGGRLLIGNASALGTGLVTQTQTSIIALLNPAASLTLDNDFQLNNSSMQIETPNAGQVFTIAGDIAGGPDVNLIAGNGGTVVLSGNNSFNGLIRLRSGTLGITNAAGVNSALAIRAEGGDRTIVILDDGQLVTTRLTSLVGGGALVITVDTGTNDVEFSGSLRDGNGLAGDTLGIIKTGSGTITVSNANPGLLGRNETTGGFGVSQGTLNLTGRMANNIGVSSGATLAGTGVQDVGTTAVSGTLSPGDARSAGPAIGTLTLSNLTLAGSASILFDLGAPSIDTVTPINDLVVVTGDLELGGSLFNFNILPGFTAGTYRLMTYGGTVNGTANLGLLPAGFTYTLSTGGGFVDLLVELADFYWDGTGPAGNGIVNGGTGTWNGGNANWTNAGGNASIAWQNNARAFFTGTGGTVTVDGDFTHSGLIFTVDGYTLNPAAGASLAADAGSIEVASGVAATINVALVGTNGLAKEGGGTLVLGGSNSFTGGLIINDGTLAVTQAAALGADAVTINGVGQTLRFDASMTVANDINGVGIGYGIDTGANTVILNGSLSGDGADKFGSGTLVLNNAINAQPQTLAVVAGSLIVNGGVQGGVVSLGNTVLGGTGTITQTAILSGSSTLSPGAAPGQAGTLTLGSLSMTAAGRLLFDLGLTGVVGGSNDLVVVTGNLALDGTLLVNPLAGWGGPGRYRLFNYGGALIDNGLELGGILLDADGVSFAIDTSVAGQINLDVTYAGAFNWDGNGDAGDGIVEGGPGIWNGSANNWTNSDGLFNLAYVDSFDSVANFGGAAGGAVEVAGTRSFGTINFTQTDYVLGGEGDLLIAGGTINVAAGQASIDVVIAGTGGLTKGGTGNLVLNAANSYTGGTALTAGTITVGNAAALSSGRLTISGGAALAAGAAGLTLANAITTLGIGTIDTAGNTLTLSGIIDGAGSIAKAGAGTLVLSGVNTYSGGTNLAAGTIRIGNDSALGTGTLTIADGATLQAGAASLSVANAIELVDGGTIDVNGEQLSLGGVISGSAPLTVVDSQSLASAGLTLTGSNSYTGGTIVTGTALQISQDANLGNADGGITLAGGTLRTTASFATARGLVLGTGGGTLDVAADTSLTSSGTISGTSLTKTGAGTLVLNSANSHSGGTALAAGTIVVGNAAALGSGALAMAGGTTLRAGADALVLANALSTAGSATIDTGSGTFTLAGAVSGAGSLAKAGTGTLVLNGVNSHAGGTLLTAGAIVAGNNSALGSGALTMASGTTLSAAVTDLVLANAIILQGAATISSGAAPAALTLAGAISGAGGLTKTGSGLLTLAGTSSYTGPTGVAAGTLNVTGTLASAVTVASGAGLTGTGTLGALTVAAGAAVSPGAPATTNIATLNVAGPASLAGSYTVNVTPTGADRITAAGPLALGGSLAIVPSTATPFTQFNQVFTVASGSSRTGSFATVTGLDQFGIVFAPVLDYTATQANIRLAPASLEGLANRFGGATGNALEAARAFDRAVALGYTPQPFFPVYAAGTALPRTLRELSGEQRATERRVVLDGSRVVRETALDRLNLGLSSLVGQQVSSSDGDSALTFWLRGAGSWGRAETSGAATAFKTEQYGLLTGIDWSRDALTVGGMFHYTTTDVEFSVLGGSSRVESVGGTVYAGYRRDGGLVLNAGFSLASARTSGSRAITLPGFAQSLTGRSVGTSYQIFGEVAYDLLKSGNTRLEPFFRNAYIGADLNALTETGGVAALAAPKQAYNINVANAGVRISTVLNGGKVMLNGSASWQGTSGAREAATFIGIPATGQNGDIRSVTMDADALLLQGGLGFNLSDTIRFNVDYSGLFGKRNDDHGGRATLNIRF